MRRWRPSPKRISGGWAQRTYEVINSSAEAFLASTLDHFDWIYADPDRRSAGGRKLVRLEDCSPDIPKLLPELRRIAPNLCVKNSPLFDVGETFRLFGPCRTEVVSLHDECKEVVVYTDGTGPLPTAVALELGEFSCTPAEARATPCDKPFDPAAYRWLLIPDVALAKSPADADLPARPRRHSGARTVTDSQRKSPKTHWAAGWRSNGSSPTTPSN